MVKVLALALALFATPSFSKTLTLHKDRTVFINGTVSGAILNQANEVYQLAIKSSDPIYFVINSPGGSVFAGLQMLTAIKAAQSRGVKFHCLTALMAASMAFQFLAACDFRYAFENSLLLFHPMAIDGESVRLTADEMDYTSEQMRALEKPLVRALLNALNISATLFYKHYNRETLWTAYSLLEVSPNFLTVVDDAEGLPVLFSPMR
jgi:ATP-dependent protease ClpP protease subunit